MIFFSIIFWIYEFIITKLTGLIPGLPGSIHGYFDCFMVSCNLDWIVVYRDDEAEVLACNRGQDEWWTNQRRTKTHLCHSYPQTSGQRRKPRDRQSWLRNSSCLLSCFPRWLLPAWLSFRSWRNQEQKLWRPKEGLCLTSNDEAVRCTECSDFRSPWTRVFPNDWRNLEILWENLKPFFWKIPLIGLKQSNAWRKQTSKLLLNESPHFTWNFENGVHLNNQLYHLKSTKPVIHFHCTASFVGFVRKCRETNTAS